MPPLSNETKDYESIANIDRSVCTFRSGTTSSAVPSRAERLVSLVNALIAFQGEHSPIRACSAISAALRRFDKRTKDIAGPALLRAWSYDKSCFDDLPDPYSIIELFDELHSDNDLYKLLRLTAKSQNFEKESKLQPVAVSVEEQITAKLDQVTSVDISVFRSEFLKVLRSNTARATVLPFLQTELADSRLRTAMNAVEVFLETSGAAIIDAYSETIDLLSAYKDEAASYPTLYSKIVLGRLADGLTAVATDHFRSTPYSKPANISLSTTEKRYPFHTAGSKCQLGVYVQNEGPGHALSVMLTATVAEGVKLASTHYFLGELPAGKALAEFVAEVPCKVEGALIEFDIEWRNYDNTFNCQKAVLAFDPQQYDVDWSNLRYADPFSLEPIGKVENLVGRQEILDALVARVLTDGTSSSYIYGQKRIGKTSVAKAFQDKIVTNYNDRFIVVYLEAGDYVHEEASVTTASLGRLICTSIISEDAKFNHVPIPEFGGALSPLTGFLAELRSLAPSKKVIIILDEFDELPPSLYQRTAAGDAFFITLRSLSGKPGFAFLLVGGEKIARIVELQGDRMNKFTPERLDYFSKSEHWADFIDLVQRPVSEWLEFTEPALDLLFETTAGNPYFTKLICRELFDRMVQRRDSHATDREVHEAISATLTKVQSPSFQHFWTDGILDSGDKVTQRSQQRRKVLLALSDLFRRRELTTEDNIQQRALEYGLDPSTVTSELREFVLRRVLLQNAGDQYDCLVPLFGAWLRDLGSAQVLATFEDSDQVLARRQAEESARVSSDEYSDLVSKWPTYKGQTISTDDVRTWLQQFTDVYHQRLMFQLLRRLRFYSQSLTREKMREANDTVHRGLTRRIDPHERKRRDVLVTYLDSPGKSGAWYAKLYADENGIYQDNVIERSKLSEALTRSPKQALVFIDDFVGTGGTACKGFEQVEQEAGEQIRTSGVQAFFVAITGFETGKRAIAKCLEMLNLPITVHFCDPLSDADRCFHEKSNIYKTQQEREQAKTVAYEYGVRLEKKQPLGYGNGEALVVFDGTCPNNTLPIIWKKTSTWTPLFLRS